MTDEKITRDAILKDYPRMKMDDAFTFRCGKDMDCFTCCCRDVSIILTPYDVLRMKNALHMDSTEFLRKYTLTASTNERNIPVLLLKMDEEQTCPFVSEEGCSIYGHRPWACRMYPLGAAEPQNPNPTDHAFNFLLKEDLCHGHGEGRAYTVREWIADQGIEEYDMMGASFKALMLHPGWNESEALTAEKRAMYYMTCYDLDRFRRFVFESRFLELFEVEETRVDAMKTDDEELLDFGMQWLMFSLFNEKSMKIRKSVMAQRCRAEEAEGAAPPPSR
jgi:Fe-S-cluster containining protein